jgi:predicted amidohydrolase
MIKIAIAQLDVKGADPAANLDAIARLAGDAAAAGALVVGCPEMCLTGFDWKRNEALLGGMHQRVAGLRRIAREAGVDVFATLPEKTESGRPANTLYYIKSDGGISGVYRKIHRFSLFGEDRHVEAGDEVVVCPGCLGPTGLSVCYDLRFPELFRACAERGARVQLLPSAFPHPRLDHWRVLVRARAIENQSFMVAVNQCGVEDANPSIRYFGHSMVVDPWGEVVFEAGEEEGLFFARIDLGRVDEVREKMDALRDRRKDLFKY